MNNFPVGYFNSNDGSSILGFGEGDAFVFAQGDSMSRVQQFIDVHANQYIFACLSYDLKNQFERLTSNNADEVEFPLAIFWTPKYVVRIKNKKHTYVQGVEDAASNDFIDHFLHEHRESNALKPHVFQHRTAKEDYLRHVRELKHEIQLGNIYEVNYCQEYFAENVELQDPVALYYQLNRITKAPYSCYFNFGDHIVLSGSPERYIRKESTKLTSSPIKGTKKRGTTPEEDLHLKNELLLDQKERSENVMIVDLVRNDLSKVAHKGSVKVDELFGIYTFETVHQMISTVSCTLELNTNFIDILRASFPMGSMTGAPKISAMQLIEEHEDFQRGIYSGSIGFIAPNGDFDFNVIIRSLVYNKPKKYLSCAVGGAITIQSDPENEYEECQVKIQRILQGI